MADAHLNFAYSTVATAPSPATSGTSVTVWAGQGALFPAVPFNAVICPVGAQPTTLNAEIVRATALSTDTFTITRAQESTSARTVVVGDQFFAGVTAKTLTDIESGAVRNGVPRMVVRTTDSATRASTTTLADDSVLVFPIAANEVWRIDTHLLVIAASGGGSSSTADLKVGFSQPAGCSGNWGSVGAYATELASWAGMGSTGSPIGLINSGSFTTALNATELGLAISGVWVNGATPGNIGFQWAQGVSDVSTILMARGSHMMGWRLE